MRPCPVAHQGRLHMSRVRTSLSTLLMAAVCAALVLQRPDVVAQSNGTSLQFSGTNQYVTFGPAPGLGASNFTLEVWFKRTGAGATTTTGTGGIAAAARSVGVASITGAADGERPLAAPAVAQVKDGNRLGLGHRSLQR